MDNQQIWRGMTRAELDAAYDNTIAVKDSAEQRTTWTVASDQFRAAHPQLLDLAYGERPRNKIDVFRSGAADAPLLVFFHGGYWQRNAKEVFSCMAAGPLARGIDVALPGYTLAPEATLTEIVAETHAALRWLRKEGPAHGVAKNTLIASGWSAGGHLTAMAMPLAEVDAGLAISGIFDVEPCRLNNLNDKLHLSASEAKAMSPLLHLPAIKKPLTVAFGTDELPELQRQSREYFEAWTQDGGSGALLPLEPHNHFSILRELSAPGGRLTRACEDLVRQLRA